MATATPKTTLNIHPKVFAGVVVQAIVAVLLFIANGIDPSIFAPLGALAVPVASVVALLAGGLAGWIKSVKLTDALPDTVSIPLEVTAPDPLPETAVVPTLTPADAVPPAAAPVKRSHARKAPVATTSGA